MSFLSRSYERHFNERPYLNHTCYLFITKTNTGAHAAAIDVQHPLPGLPDPERGAG